MTLDQFLAKEEAQNKIKRLAFEGKLVDTFRKRVNDGEFENEAAARTVSDSTFAKALEVTKGAAEAILSDSRDWDGLHTAYGERLKSKNTLENQWAQVRADLQRRMGGTHQGNGFSRTVSMELNEDGSATIPAEMIDILLKATEWQNKGKIQKVSGFVNATESGAITLEVKVNNPAKG